MESDNQFADKHGEQWALCLDVGLCREVRNEHGVDLANWIDGKAAEQLYRSDEKLVDVLWTLCLSQAERRELSEVDFARRLNGDVLAAALTAIEGAVLGFTRPDRRELIRQTIEAARAAHVKQLAAIAKQIETDLPRAIDRAVERGRRKFADELAKSSTSGS